MHEIVSFSKEIEFKNMINKITSISLEHTLMLQDKFDIKGDFIISGTYKMTSASQIENDFSYKIPVDIEVDEKYDLSNLVIDIDNFTYEVIDEEILKVNIDLLLDKLEIKEKLFFEEKKNEKDEEEIISSDDLFMENNDAVPLEIPIEKDCIEEKIEIIGNDLINNNNREESIIEDVSIDEETLEKLDTEKINSTILDSADNSIKEIANSSIEKISNGSEKVKNEYVDNTKLETIEMDDTEIELENSNDAESLFSSFDSSKETYSTYSVYIIREGDTLEEIINKYSITKEKLEEYNDLSDLKIGAKVIIPSIKNE